MAFDNWLVVDTRPGLAVPGSLVNVTQADAVIVISHAPYARRSVQLAALCHDAGAYVLAITDRISSPLLKVGLCPFPGFGGKSTILSVECCNPLPYRIYNGHADP